MNLTPSSVRPRLLARSVRLLFLAPLLFCAAPARANEWILTYDVTEANGTVYLLPYSRAGTREVVPHQTAPGTGELEGYFGSDPGDPVIVPAGSIACFSSTVLHRSGFNRTPAWRRVYLPQYSAEPLRRSDGKLAAFAEPFLVNGERRDGRGAEVARVS